MRIEHDGVSCARNGNLSVDDRRCARKREQPRFNASLLEHLNQQVGVSLEIRRISCDIRYREEYPLKTPNSGPHGLAADKDGTIWFTAISGGYVGKLDPKSGEIAEYRPSDGAKIDPHTPVFAHDGILWFTNEETNFIGRLDPKTGKMTLTKVPTPHAVPYGIVILPNNTPDCHRFGINCRQLVGTELAEE